MVQDQGRRQQYLTTLRAEANRLGHLVENVLAYSRIERGRADGRIQTIAVPELIDATKHRLLNRGGKGELTGVFETFGYGTNQLLEEEWVAIRYLDNACL